MYCKYCGKYVLGERDICDECLAKQNQAQPVFAQYAPPKPTTTKKGFGKGLTATILSESSIITWYISIILIAMAMTLLSPPTTGGTQPVDQTTGTVFFVFAVLLTLITIAANVIAIVFGAQTIQSFTYAKRNNLPKPVLAFVFGLIGLIGACFILTYTLLFNGIIITAYLSAL
ncbi:MAG: hypothetical protein IJX06_00045 [Clostridia bacterium]|nr:hypothetical protein [Clostridia bacterium]